MALDTDGRVTHSNLPPQIRFGSPAEQETEAPLVDYGSMLYADAKEAAIRAFQSSYMRTLLDVHHGNVSRAARTAGVSRRTLHRWLAQLGMTNGEDTGDKSDADI